MGQDQEHPPFEIGGGESPPEAGSAYPLLEALGSHGTHSTWLCSDPAHGGRKVVQKRVDPDLAAQLPDLIQGGIQGLARLDHENLAAVLDFGWEGESAYLIREFVEGVPFLQGIASLDFKKILKILAQILDVLDYLDTQNQPHLNLNPDNIILSPTPDGPRVTVLDFGLLPLLTPVGPNQEVRGSPPYTAPEFNQSRHYDIRSDLYSFGVLIYRVLGGREPHWGSNAEEFFKHQIKKDPPSLRSIQKGVPKELSNFVKKLMSRVPKQRPNHVQEAMEEFADIYRSHTSQAYPWPPALSDPQAAFHFDWFAKMFRRVLLQGRGWVFEGKRGSGKSYLAKWLQRYFWINQKQVRFFHGAQLPLLEGELVLNPAEPVYVIIDDADLGPTQAWLEARPYQHVVLLGEDLAWAKQNPRWQCFSLPSNDEEFLKKLLKEELASQEAKVFQTLKKRHWEQPQVMVQEARALARQGLVTRGSEGWQLQEEKFLKTLFGSYGSKVASPLLSLAEAERKILSLLSLVQVPLAPDSISEWVDLKTDLLRAPLQGLIRNQMVSRRIWMGQEFFLAQVPVPTQFDGSLTSETVMGWVRGLQELSWFDAALRTMDRWFTSEEARRDPELVLLRAELLLNSERFTEVLKLIQSDFVKPLPAAQAARAFLILGQGLRSLKKLPQAEASFKKSLPYYQKSGDLDSQMILLKEMGVLSLQIGEQERALKYFSKALELGSKKGASQVVVGQVEVEVGELYFKATDYERAEEYFQKAAEQLFASRNFYQLAQVYLKMARLMWQRGEAALAEYHFREALAMALFQRAPDLQGEAYEGLALVAEKSGNLTNILERLNQAVDAYSKGRRVRDHGRTLVRRAYFSENNRQSSLAERDAQTALKIGQDLKDLAMQGQAHLVLGKIRRRNVKRLPQARKHFEAAQEILSRGKNSEWLWECEFERGEIERFKGSPEAARQHYRQALELLDQYTASLSPGKREQFLQEGKRDQVEMALKWLKS